MHQLLLMVVLAAVKGGSTIKSVAVASPVVGSQSTFGRVDLAAPATQLVVITLRAGNLHRGDIPESVIVAPGQSMQTFVIKTEPVAAPTTLTLTARTPGSPDATANFTVIPPSLTILDCEPKSLPGGSHATCKVWLDGVVAAGATPQVALSTSNSAFAYPEHSSVTVPAGSRWVTFDAIARDLPQSGTAMISAVYAGVTKSSGLTVTPAAIKSFGCAVVSGSPEDAYGSSQCFVVGGDYYYSSNYAEHRKVVFVVRITAPAPPSGYKIPLFFTFANANGEPVTLPLGMQIVNTLEVPAGKDRASYPFHTEPTASTYVMKVSAKDPITHNSYDTELTVTPPQIKQVHFQPSPISGVPLGGKDVHVYVEFKSEPPSSGIAYDVTYAGTTDIKGPARVRVPKSDFTVKVSPCAINPPCHVSMTLGGVTGTLTVNP